MPDDERVIIYTAPNAPHCPECGAPLVLVRYQAGGRSWPALCCRKCPYWRPYRGRTGGGSTAERGRR